MKTIGSLVILIAVMLGGCGITYQDPILGSLPEYQSKEFYTSGGFQDYTDYAKYTYDFVPFEDLNASKYFTKTTIEDVEEILLHIDNFENWVEVIGDELKENYDFDKTVVSVGDYFYIRTKAGEPIGQGTYGKFSNYTVYYFDVDTKILYYFHNNI